MVNNSFKANTSETREGWKVGWGSSLDPHDLQGQTRGDANSGTPQACVCKCGGAFQGACNEPVLCYWVHKFPNLKFLVFIEQ
jgi:hypothetical protein